MQVVALVDNDLFHRRAAEAALRSAGYDVITAEDGVSGLELIREKRPAFVVLELMLPRLNGFAVCQEIRDDPGLRRTSRVIVASSKAYPVDIRQALELGAVAYLTKPFPSGELVAAVRKAGVDAPSPVNEISRVAALHGYRILDTAPEQGFDDLTQLASYICQTPIALISLVDSDRQWFKSRVGTELRETSRQVAFCAHAILQSDVFVVPDATLDERFKNNVLVTVEPRIRFYAGAVIATPAGEVLGTLCVVDKIPRQLSRPQLECLTLLARQVRDRLELRRLAELGQHIEESSGTNARHQ